MKKGKNGFYCKYIKRALDIFFALMVLICFSWLYLILALLVRIKLGSPIIFHQVRPGKIDPKTGKEKIFKLCKFRSMTDAKDENGNLLPGAQRLTKFGKLLRATSLDELPEAWNILKGDMSWIGPRPWLTKYLDYYNDFEHQRHEVRPGLTGLSQVSGRNALTWKKRFEKDVEYVQNVSVWLDIKIVFMTIKKVFVREGIEFKNNQTIMEYFADRDSDPMEDKASIENKEEQTVQ